MRRSLAFRGLIFSIGTLCRSKLRTSFEVSSSTSLPEGALATYFSWATWSNSFRMRSPPRSPSKKAVASFSLLSLMMVSGIFAPSRAMTFPIPHFNRLITSALPSTMTISFASSMRGPADSFSGPYFSTFGALRVSATSRKISSVLGRLRIVHSCRICLALSIIALRLASRMSSTFSKTTFESHGPTLFMLSKLAAIMAVETRSKLVGIIIDPLVLSCFDCSSICILPIRPDF